MSRKEKAYKYIKEEILSGRMKQNTPIRENELEDSLQMSRTPIREALRELEAEGVVVSYVSRGTFVAALTPYDVEEIFELRSLMEEWALKKAIRLISEAELDKAEQMLRAADESGEWSDIHQADLYLHNMIVEKSGSKRLVSFMRNLNTQIERISFSSALDPIRKEETFNEHMAILQSIRARDLEESQRLLNEHLKYVAEAAIEVAKIM